MLSVIETVKTGRIPFKTIWASIRREPLVFITFLTVILVIGLFVAFPLYKVIRYPALKDYLAFFGRTRWLNAGVHSIFITVISTAATTLCGFLFAYGMMRVNIIGKKFWDTVAILPILSPPFVVAISYILLFGNRGLITYKLLGVNLSIYGWKGLLLAQTVTFFPYAYLLIKNTLHSIAANLEWAAQNLGSSRWQVFCKVVLPLARPGIAGAALLVAISVLADFGNPIIIAGNYAVLPTEAYMQIVGWFNLPAAAVLATTLIIPTVILFLLQQYWVNRRTYTTITGKSSSLKRPRSSRFEFWFFNIFCWLFGGLIVLIYGTLLWGAFSKVWGVDWSFTLQNFIYVLDHGNEIWNSIYFSLVASLLCAVFATLTAYLVKREKIGINSLLDLMVTLPAAIPGIFLGVGYILAFNTPPLVLTGTATIMILALLFWNLPMGYRSGIAAMHQLDVSIEKASLNLGANHFLTFRKIILPLMKPTFFATFTMAFLRSVTNLSITVFLASSKTVVGTVSILSLVNNGAWGGAAAMTVVLIAIALITLYISTKLLGNEKESIFLN
jgi:ABC-type Fe3+ transport system, permease component